ARRPRAGGERARPAGPAADEPGPCPRPADADERASTRAVRRPLPPERPARPATTRRTRPPEPRPEERQLLRTLHTRGSFRATLTALLGRPDDPGQVA
ncbi:MAG: hypothetical protein R3F62_31065, partial [Planctomycetota bacterium]